VEADADTPSADAPPTCQIWTRSGIKSELLSLDYSFNPGAEWPSGRLGDFPVGRPANELKKTSLQTALRSRVKFMSGPLS